MYKGSSKTPITPQVKVFKGDAAVQQLSGGGVSGGASTAAATFHANMPKSRYQTMGYSASSTHQTIERPRKSVGFGDATNIEIGGTVKGKKPFSAIKRKSTSAERPPFTLYGKSGKTRQRSSSKKRQPSKYR